MSTETARLIGDGERGVGDGGGGGYGSGGRGRNKWLIYVADWE